MDAKSYFYSLGRALYRIDALYAEFASQSGVAPTLLWVMYALNDGNAHTQREICAEWDLPKSTVNTVVTALRESGCVTLEQIKGKRREMTVVLTESGKAYAEKILADIYKREAEVYKLLTLKEREIPEGIERMTELLTNIDHNNGGK